MKHFFNNTKQIEVLLILDTGPKYGYEIYKQSKGLIKAKSVHTILSRLKQYGYVEIAETIGQLVYYQLTPEGNLYLNKAKKIKKILEEK